MTEPQTRTKYSYDAASNLIGTAYPNQTALAFVYDAANRLTQVRNSYRGSADSPLNPITNFTYALDAIGNRLQVTDGSGKVTSYAYDKLSELISVTRGRMLRVSRTIRSETARSSPHRESRSRTAMMPPIGCLPLAPRALPMTQMETKSRNNDGDEHTYHLPL